MKSRGKGLGAKYGFVAVLTLLAAILGTAFPSYSLAQSLPTGTPGLVAYYPFDGDTRDYSGNGNHGTNSGATFVSGTKGQALKFDGVDDYVSAPVNINPDVMPQVTMVAWVQADKATGTVISQDNGGFDRTIDIDNRGGGTGWSAFSGSGAVLGYRPVTIGEWVFIAAVYDQNAKKVRLHVNDALYEEAGTLSSGWNYINIGRNPTYGATLPGTVDEVRIYNYALSASEIASLGAGAGPAPAPASAPAGGGAGTISLSWLDFAKDRVGSGGNPNPDGQGDGHFQVTLDRSGTRTVEMITLYTSDEKGSPASGQVWNTAPDGYWILGVYRDGTRLNPQDTKLSDPVSGRVTYELFANDSGYFKPGQSFGVTVRFSDGKEVKAVASIGATPPPTATTAPASTPAPTPPPAATPAPVLRITGTTLAAGERTAAPNDAVTVPIHLEKASRIGSLNFSIRYDPSVLKVNRVEGGDLVRGALFQPSTKDAGIVRFGVATQGAEGVSGDGPVAYVEFTAVGQRGSRSEITLGELLATDTGGQRLGLNLRNGRVTIAAKVKGDYDGDGRLTAKDALAALKMSVRELPEDLNLDMDEDSRVSAEDARRILAAALASQMPSVSAVSLPSPQPTPSPASPAGPSRTASPEATATRTVQLPPELQNLRLPPLVIPTPVPAPTTLYRPPSPPIPQTTTLDLPTETVASQPISPARATTVSLPDGARVEIPAGAVASESVITMKKLKLSGPEAKGNAVYEIGPGDINLRLPATLVLPFDPASIPQDLPDAQVKVAVLRPAEGWVEVPAKVDLAQGRATVQTDHFSKWRIFSPGWWARETLDKAPVKLAVPYYPQGGSGWCWAGSTQMLLKYYGRDMEIWGIAEAFGADYSTGLNAGEFLIGYYTGFLEKQGLEVERSLLGWLDNMELTGYLMYQIRQGRPIWLALPNVGHAVLVVGFDTNGIYINDSSGYLTEFVKGADKVDERHLNPTFLTWSEWGGFGGALVKGSLTTLVKHTLVVLNTPPAQTSAVTMSVMSTDIAFRIAKAKGVAVEFENAFQWDGTKPNGYYFTGLPPFFIGLPDNNPDNSDTLSKFVVQLANSSNVGDIATVRLLLDGNLLREKADIYLEPRTSNIEVDLFENTPYSFADNPLRPGPHEFQLSLTAGGRVVDRATISFTMGPAQPSDLKAERTADAVKLSWQPSQENAKGLDQIAYVIWKDGKLEDATVWGNEYEDRLAAGDTREHQYRVEAISWKGDWFFSSIGLNSHVSDDLRVPAPKAATTTQIVYRLQRPPAINHPTKPTAAGVSATIDANSAVYSHPDTGVGTATRSISWSLPEEIQPGRDYSMTFETQITVAKINTVKKEMLVDRQGLRRMELVETYVPMNTNPFFRAIAGFSQGGRELAPWEEIFQYSPDGGKTWVPPLSPQDAWEKYPTLGTKQVAYAHNGIWSSHVQKYSPPTPTRSLPLTTPPQGSTLPFRLRPTNDVWPDKLIVSITAEAAGLSTGGGSSLATVVYTYQRQ